MKKWFKKRQSAEADDEKKDQRETRRDSINNVFDETLLNHDLARDGKTLIAKGYSMTGPREADAYVERHILHLMGLIADEIREKIANVQGQAQAQLNIAEKDIISIEAELTEKTPNSTIHSINTAIQNAHAKQQEIESMLFPERGFHKLLGPIMEKLKNMLSPGDSSHNADLLKDILDRKVLLSEAEVLLKRGKEIAKNMPFRIHDSLYPPKKRHISLFYILCLVLVVAEIGFSLPVLKNIIKVTSVFPWHYANLFFGMIYAVGMTISYAILARTGLDNILRNETRTRWFIIISVIIFLIQAIFYSIPKDPGDFNFWYNLSVGIIISFFSIAFALANAFLFNKVSSLHTIYSELNGITSVPALTKKKEEYMKEQMEKLAILKGDKIVLEEELAYYEILLQNIKGKTEHLLEISIACFNEGFNKKLEEIISNNQELQMLLVDKLKTNYYSGNKK